jgi:hypothetical protein
MRVIFMNIKYRFAAMDHEKRNDFKTLEHA